MSDRRAFLGVVASAVISAPFSARGRGDRVIARRRFVFALGATTTIPIVDPVMGDSVAFGLSTSLARPGKNITGSVQFSVEAGAKRLELLREASPRITRIAVLINPANAGSPLQLQAMRTTASALKLDLQVLEGRNAKDLGETFAAIAQARIEGI